MGAHSSTSPIVETDTHRHPHDMGAWFDRSRQVIALLAPFLVCGLALGLFTLSPDNGRAGPLEVMALGVLFLGLWMTRTLPDHLASIVFFFGAVAVLALPPEVAFSGFHSDAVWLVLGGLVMSATMKSTGLADRVANQVLRRTGDSYAALVTTAMLLGAMLIFMVPSAVARVMMLVPATVALAERLDYGPGSPGRAGIVLAAILGTILPAYAVLPSIIPNIAMAGAAHTLYGISFTYGHYLLINFPVLALSTLIALPLAIIWLFPARVPGTAVDANAAQEPWTSDQRRLVAVILIAIALWTTDVFHGVRPGWVALGAAILCLIPSVGPGRAAPALQSGHLGVWLLIAAFVSLGAAIDFTGLDAVLGRWLVGTVEFSRGDTVGNVAKLFGIGTVATILTTNMAAPSAMTPLAQHFAAATGWPLETILLLQVPTWFYFIMPYQMPILVIAVTMAGVTIRQTCRLLFAIALLGLTVFLPLHVLWLGWLGYL